MKSFLPISTPFTNSKIMYPKMSKLTSIRLNKIKTVIEDRTPAQIEIKNNVDWILISFAV